MTGTDPEAVGLRLLVFGYKNLAKSSQQAIDCANLDMYHFVHIPKSRRAPAEGERDMLFDNLGTP
jgi:hypothetical protein